MRKKKKKCCTQPTEVSTLARKIPPTFPRGMGVGGKEAELIKQQRCSKQA